MSRPATSVCGLRTPPHSGVALCPSESQWIAPFPARHKARPIPGNTHVHQNNTGQFPPYLPAASRCQVPVFLFVFPGIGVLFGTPANPTPTHSKGVQETFYGTFTHNDVTLFFDAHKNLVKILGTCCFPIAELALADIPSAWVSALFLDDHSAPENVPFPRHSASYTLFVGSHETYRRVEVLSFPENSV